MKTRRIDREKIERADREAKLLLEAERHAREAKTARLREQRQLLEASIAQTPPAPVAAKQPPRQRKPTRKVIEVD
ncbi:hypothetical protein NKI32_19030 [Mesorhizobium sp. M0761]|uniref:hypothetical protein n=1 Tax=unclassified Mesorhizobium TaxID=325217 RepID=UPI0003CE703A|nr:MULTISPECIES: hypothetical protein [unclassified Mesorhizobium]ESW89169.1 hypothetical protein X773_03265 [Mesorhizobium sp. LSJC285A00]ESX06171.1 hypothetical protein X769_05420 [Mesorhizobium sp. LSJC268A00]ESZ16377.1 hypothetical protein X735_05845 [Mesorhizobium sp. L2C085B000]ESZ31840.1 hypothetical protein X733_20230 [Mesorhizobium sp. L2C067A000]ESX26713.1 hypothetical protein X767_05325 [Mesorhizobium sp. LSJC264A00]